MPTAGGNTRKAQRHRPGTVSLPPLLAKGAIGELADMIGAGVERLCNEDGVEPVLYRRSLGGDAGRGDERRRHSGRKQSSADPRRSQHRMGQLLQRYELDDIDKGDRSRIITMMKHRAEVEAWHRSLPLNQRLKLNHASTILGQWTKANAPPKPAGATRPTALAKTEQALAEAHDEIHHLKERVAELIEAGVVEAGLTLDDVRRELVSRTQRLCPREESRGPL